VGSDKEPGGRDQLAAIYRRALPQVYGYLLPRCGSAAVAEDLAAETFMAAVAAAGQRRPEDVSVAWLIGPGTSSSITGGGRCGNAQVDDLPAAVAALRSQGASFRDDIVTGVGVRQIVLEDPAGNLIELFEPITGYHERGGRHK
jgi:hypothetical protein